MLHVPNGDVLIHAGDFCNTGIERDVHKFAKWIRSLPHRWKIMVAGNHDRFFQQQPELARAYLDSGVIYLEDSGCEIEGLHFWGSPWQPWFMDWAFNLPRKGPQLRERWGLIPSETDVLVTHCPAFGVLDQVHPKGQTDSGTGPLGCEELAARLQHLRPRLHIFGHIHDSYGCLWQGQTLAVNASICDEDYRPVHKPVVIDWDSKGSKPAIAQVESS